MAQQKPVLDPDFIPDEPIVDDTDFIPDTESVLNDARDTLGNTTPEVPVNMAPPITTSEAEPNWWDKLTTTPPAIREFIQSLSNKITEPQLPTEYFDPQSTLGGIEQFGNKLSAMQRGLAGGMLEGAGEFINPLDVGTTLATGGTNLAAKAGMKVLPKILDVGSRIASGGVATHGAERLLNPESTWSERGAGVAELAGGLFGLRSNLPRVASDIISPPATPDMPTELPIPPKKRKIVFRDGEYWDKETGEVLDQTGTPKEQPLDRNSEFFKKNIDPKVERIRQILADVEKNNAAISEHSQGRIGALADVKKVDPKTGKTDVALEAFNLPRALMASSDLSAPLRQGLPLIHKKEFWKAIGPMFRAWATEDGFRMVQQEIADKPLFKSLGKNPKTGKPLPSFAEKAGLQLTDLTDITKREEVIMSTWAEKVPGVRRSNRAYTAFLNKLRADTFESLVNKGALINKQAGQINQPLAEEIANFVNTATGRGSLGPWFERSAIALNKGFFAPRLIASRLQMLNPHYYWSASPTVRKEALKSLFAVATFGNTMGQLARMAGAEVESDPASSDFGKIRIGDTRLDPFAGFQQYIVLANRLSPREIMGMPVNPFGGRMKSSTTGLEYDLGDKFGASSRRDVLYRFAEGKANPVVSFVLGWLEGKDFTGKPFDVPEEIAQRFVPIFLQDLKELATENPDILPGWNLENYEEFHPENLPFALPSAFGMSVQHYGRGNQ